MTIRRGVAVLAVLVAALLAVPPASATPGEGPLNRRASGPFSGTQTFEFNSEGCSFVHQVFRGTYETRRGRSGRFLVDVCVETGSGFTYTGTFRITTPGGARLRGSVDGTTNAALPESSLDLTLTVTSGTKRFEGVTGTVALSGVWRNEPPNTLGRGLTSGDLTADLQPPPDGG